MSWMSFANARITARKQHMFRCKQYREWQRGAANIPSQPERVYADEWKGWDDFLLPHYAPWDTVLRYAQDINANSQAEWIKYPRMQGAPADPDVVYAAEWKGWDDFLSPRYDPWKKVLRYAQDINASTQAEWAIYPHPAGVPNSPDVVYAAEWNGWDAFLAPKRVSWAAARGLARGLRLQTATQWKNTTHRPANFPADPTVYREFTSWDEFLGTGIYASAPFPQRDSLIGSMQAIRAYAAEASSAADKTIAAETKVTKEEVAKLNAELLAVSKGGSGHLSRRDKWAAEEQLRQKKRKAAIADMDADESDAKRHEAALEIAYNQHVTALDAARDRLAAGRAAGRKCKAANLERVKTLTAAAEQAGRVRKQCAADLVASNERAAKLVAAIRRVADTPALQAAKAVKTKAVPNALFIAGLLSGAATAR